MELNLLCKHIEIVRSSQASISIYYFTEFEFLQLNHLNAHSFVNANQQIGFSISGTQPYKFKVSMKHQNKS